MTSTRKRVLQVAAPWPAPWVLRREGAARPAHSPRRVELDEHQAGRLDLFCDQRKCVETGSVSAFTGGSGAKLPPPLSAGARSG